PLLQVRDLSVRIAGGRGEVHAVGGIGFELAAGQTLGIVGESGSGKSQTALALLGLQAPNASVGGSIRFEGRELLGLPEREWNRIRGRRIGLVFQDPMTSLNPHLRIGTQMAEVLVRHRGLSWRAALAECARMLDAVRIAAAASRLRQYPHEFSGGMRQRVLIAAALLCQPALLVADEPTTALDVTVQAEILDLLAELQAGLGLALLLISHDLDVVAEVCEQVLVMYAGRVVESGPAAQLLAGPRHPYSAGLLAARPRLDTPAGQPLRPIPGQPPDLARLPAGCAFRPRCTAAGPACAVRPELGPPQYGRAWACHFPVVETALPQR
ncbi:MAG TPA: oligopeptide/dipeptide ABC transporter ATP-binding protein, partial [Nevskia sp.]|nr:oligopeptide/dipeptide ABC transporter ATP-binding protein [Nevskia sp.]